MLAQHVALIPIIDDIAADYELDHIRRKKKPTYLMRDISSFELSTRGTQTARHLCAQLGIDVKTATYNSFRDASIAFRLRLGPVYGGPGV